jgi:hypothetical protein
MVVAQTVEAVSDPLMSLPLDGGGSDRGDHGGRADGGGAGSGGHLGPWRPVTPGFRRQTECTPCT